MIEKHYLWPNLSDNTSRTQTCETAPLGLKHMPQKLRKILVVKNLWTNLKDRSCGTRPAEQRKKSCGTETQNETLGWDPRPKPQRTRNWSGNLRKRTKRGSVWPHGKNLPRIVVRPYPYSPAVHLHHILSVFCQFRRCHCNQRSKGNQWHQFLCKFNRKESLASAMLRQYRPASSSQKPILEMISINSEKKFNKNAISILRIRASNHLDRSSCTSV